MGAAEHTDRAPVGVILELVGPAALLVKVQSLIVEDEPTARAIAPPSSVA